MADLATQVPQLDGDGTLGDLAHVETHGGDHVLVEVVVGDHVHQTGFARVLQPYQRQLHLLFEKQAALQGGRQHQAPSTAQQQCRSRWCHR